MQIIAFSTDPQVIKHILDHLGLPSEPPPQAPAAVQLELYTEYPAPLLAWGCALWYHQLKWEATVPGQGGVRSLQWRVNCRVPLFLRPERSLILPTRALGSN